MTARTWLRRSRWSLVAVVVALAVATVSAFSIDWPDYLATQVSNPRLLGIGDTGSYKKATFTLLDHKIIQADSDDGRDLGALDGTELVIVTLHVDATKVTGKGIGCSFQLAAPGPAGERHWGSDQNEVSLPYGDDDYETLCILSDKNEFDLKQIFVVPAGTAKDVSLQFTEGFRQPPTLQWDW